MNVSQEKYEYKVLRYIQNKNHITVYVTLDYYIYVTNRMPVKQQQLMTENILRSLMLW